MKNFFLLFLCFAVIGVLIVILTSLANKKISAETSHLFSFRTNIVYAVKRKVETGSISVYISVFLVNPFGNAHGYASLKFITLSRSMNFKRYSVTCFIVIFLIPLLGGSEANCSVSDTDGIHSVSENLYVLIKYSYTESAQVCIFTFKHS